MPKKPLAIALAVAVVLVISSSAVAGHTHLRHHRHGTHVVKLAALVGPTVVADDPADCTTGTAQHPGLGITGASTLKYSSNGSGSASDGTLTVMVTTPDSVTFDFTATLPANDVILAVFVKSTSDGGNLYDYRGVPGGGVQSDNGLRPPTETARASRQRGPRAVAAWFISHILFCYGPVTHVGPTGPSGPTGPTGPSGTAVSPGVTTTAPSTTAPPVTPVTTPSAGKKHKRVHHAPSRARRKRGFTG